VNIVAYAKQYLLCTIYLGLFSETMELPFLIDFTASNTPLVMLVNILLLLSILNFKIFKNRYLIGIALIGLTTMGIYSGFYVFRSFDLKLIPITIVIIMIRHYSEQYNYKTIATEELKEGMILSWASIAMFAPSRVQGLPKSTTEDMDSRLTSQQVADIIRWKDSKYGQPELVVVRKMPFAIFISIGFFIFSIMRFVTYGQ
jgi:hypothetical protein